VADWWDAEYYARSPARNPTGPASGDQRVHRASIANAGGGPEKCRCTARYAGDPNWDYGIRCVATTQPEGEAGAPGSGAAGTGADQDQSTAAGDDSAEGETAEHESSTGSGAAEGAAAGATGDWPPLQSYRALTVMTIPEEDAPADAEVDGPIEQEFLFEWDAVTSASRTVVDPMEEVTIGSSRWTRVGDSPWMEQTLSAEEQAEWEEKMAFAQHWGDPDLVEEDLETSLPHGVELVPAQIFPVPIKAAMVFDGEETVNDVHCRRYTVDTDLDYTRETGSHTTGHAKGTMWVADQAGIPPVVVRAIMDEELIVDGEPSHPSWEFDLLDINQPVTIEPPE